MQSKKQITRIKNMEINQAKTHTLIIAGDIQVCIIQSGWAGMYHVITEDPTEGDLFHEHEFLSEKEVCLRFGIDPVLLR